MKYGHAIGSLWGLGSGDGPELFCEHADDRLLVQFTGPNLPALLCDLVSGLGVFADVATEIASAFDLETAIGDQLDKIGAILVLARNDFSDDRYRTFLEIVRDSILSSRREDGEFPGTHPNLLRMVRTFIGPGPDPIVLRNYLPYSFTLSVPGVDPAETLLLISLIRLSLWAGVYGQIYIEGSGVWDSVSVGPLPGGGIWGSESVAVPGASVWGYTYTIEG